MHGYPPDPTQCEHWCSRRVSLVDAASLLIQLADTYETAGAPAAKVQRLRDLRGTVTDRDQVWLMTVPPEHPDFLWGTAYLMVVRDGEVVEKELLYTI